MTANAVEEQLHIGDAVVFVHAAFAWRRVGFWSFSPLPPSGRDGSREPFWPLVRYADMDARLEHMLAQLKAFAVTRPVTYGAPACAVVGILAGLAMKTGPQDAGYVPEMEPVRVAYETQAEPIAWPAGKTPDYVVGTDFLKMSQPPPVQMVSYDEPAYSPPPEMEVPPYVEAQHGPATPPPPADAPHWASQRGDILDVSLPEDRRPQQPIPTVLADAADVAAAGMTSR